MFRQSMTWLHTWSCLIVCWLLYFMFITGTLGYFENEIDRWMTPEVPVAPLVSVVDSVHIAQAYLTDNAGDAQNWFIRPPKLGDREARNLHVFWRGLPAAEKDEPPTRGEAILSVSSGNVIENPRETAGGRVLYRMHYLLHYFPNRSGYYIMAVATMLMFIGLMTGVIAHKKIFRDFFTFRWARGQRSWLDMHNVLSVATLPFQFMITYSGLLFTISLWMPLIALGAYGFDMDKIRGLQAELTGVEEAVRSGEPAPLLPLHTFVQKAEEKLGPGRIRGVNVTFPGDENSRVSVLTFADSVGRSAGSLIYSGSNGELQHDQIDAKLPGGLQFGGVMIALHEGLFAGPLLRWLYFLSGVLGAGMIATGAIYWAIKRKPKTHASDVGPGYRFVENMNVATIAGLLVAVGAYFWANRLLPLGMNDRPEWEVHCMFITWGLCFVHAIVRPMNRAWYEQCAAVAAVFIGLPLINALTTDTHLINSLLSRDWVMAAFDATCLVTGLVALWVALLLRNRIDSAEARVLMNSTAAQNVASDEVQTSV
ncbi:MAG: PepSY-associated TM helix domain-containing protein [Pseudomonadota bacterium]